MDSQQPSKKPKATVCKTCGNKYDHAFWGECPLCHTNLPLHTQQSGDDQRREADTQYHGGQYHTGEW